MNVTSPNLARFAAGVAILSLPIVLFGCGDRDVVAKVGRTKVTRAELDAFVDAAGGRLGNDRAAALEVLVERARLAEAARRADVDDDREVEARIAASRREILASAYLEKALEPAVREDLLRKRYQAEKDRLARRRIHVAHVVTRPTSVGKDAHDAAQARIIKAYARLAGGEPFEKVAKETSEDEVSARRGGDLGLLLEGQVDATFFETAAKLKANETSRPFESAFGFHVVKAIEDPQTVTPSFEEVRGQLAAEARREAERELVARLRNEIRTEVHLDRAGVKPPGVSVKAREGR